MQRRRVLAGVALATALVFPLAGCASGGKVRLSMQKMCQSHGGVWSQAQETCNPSATEGRQAAKQAKDICVENGGAYLPAYQHHWPRPEQREPSTDPNYHLMTDMTNQAIARMHVGADEGTPVTNTYKVPFKA